LYRRAIELVSPRTEPLCYCDAPGGPLVAPGRSRTEALKPSDIVSHGGVQVRTDRSYLNEFVRENYPFFQGSPHAAFLSRYSAKIVLNSYDEIVPLLVREILPYYEMDFPTSTHNLNIHIP